MTDLLQWLLRKVKRSRKRRRDMKQILAGLADLPEAVGLLFMLAAGGHASEIDSLLAHYPNLINLQEGTGKTPLHVAAAFGHVAAIEALLSAGAQVGAIDRYGTTPLHCAAHWDRKGAVVLLLRHGADPNALDAILGTPLHIAVSNESGGVVRILLQHGADKNKKDNRFGVSALQLARGGKSMSIARLLEEYGRERVRP